MITIYLQGSKVETLQLNTTCRNEIQMILKEKFGETIIAWDYENNMEN